MAYHSFCGRSSDRLSINDVAKRGEAKSSEAEIFVNKKNVFSLFVGGRGSVSSFTNI